MITKLQHGSGDAALFERRRGRCQPAIMCSLTAIQFSMRRMAALYSYGEIWLNSSHILPVFRL